VSLAGCVQLPTGELLGESVDATDVGTTDGGSLADIALGELAATDSALRSDTSVPTADQDSTTSPPDLVELIAEDGHSESPDILAEDLVEPDIPPEIVPQCPDHSPCDDGDPCTTDDSCLAGQCLPGAVNLTAACLYSTKPQIYSCDRGVPSPSARAVALARVNRIRALSGLPAVIYDPESDGETEDAALMMAANAELNHEPPVNWHCWTEDGFNGAGASNLHRGWSSYLIFPDPIEAIDGFLIDFDVESLGHRRWLLDPFLTQVSYGASHGKPSVPSSNKHSRAAVLKVIYPNPAPVQLAENFVAYPYGNYPTALFDKQWYLSFSMVASKESKWSNEEVDLSSAIIKVQGPGTIEKQVHSLATSNQFFGIPNHIQWKVSGLQDNIKYTVYIANLKYLGNSHSFQYTFKLVP